MDDALLLTRPIAAPAAAAPMAAVRAQLAAPPPAARVSLAEPLFAAALVACAGLSVLAAVVFGPDRQPSQPQARTSLSAAGLTR